MFCNLKNYDTYLIRQEIGIPNGLEKYMSFLLNNKLVSIVSFQFLSLSSLDSLVKT